MLEHDSKELAMRAFVQTFAQPMTAADVAPTLTCWETSVIAMMLDIHDEGEAATMWLEQHAEGHDEGDEPHGLAEAWSTAMQHRNAAP